MRLLVPVSSIQNQGVGGDKEKRPLKGIWSTVLMSKAISIQVLLLCLPVTFMICLTKIFYFHIQSSIFFWVCVFVKTKIRDYLKSSAMKNSVYFAEIMKATPQTVRIFNLRIRQYSMIYGIKQFVHPRLLNYR